MPTCVALIPARSGSKRVVDKNIRKLGSHPLIAYTIAAAQKSKVFTDIIVSTDSQKYADIAVKYGAEVPFLRPESLSGDVSPDRAWVEYTLEKLQEMGRNYDCFSILRPTSPFRRPDTIIRAWEQFCNSGAVDSLRAVEKCSQHPGKMWVIRGKCMYPLIPFSPEEQPWHSSQYQSLPEIYVQNASLEIAYCRVVQQQKTIAGTLIVPFLTEGYEGFDINSTYDWDLAEYIVKNDPEFSLWIY
jgi:CMP-N,N'-diacetyllegionaminic acid synthase